VVIVTTGEVHPERGTCSVRAHIHPKMKTSAQETRHKLLKTEKHSDEDGRKDNYESSSHDLFRSSGDVTSAFPHPRPGL
jgi:hypothetical protein